MSPLRALRLSWPREVSPEQVRSALRSLSTIGTPLVLDSIGSGGLVTHQLGLPEGRAAAATRQLRTALPGLGIEGVAQHDEPTVDLAVNLRLSTARRALRSDDAEAVSRALLAALSAARSNEWLRLRWLLVEPLTARSVPSDITLGPESWTQALLQAPFRAPGKADGDSRTALRTKQSEPGWRVLGSIAVKAATASRQKQLVRDVVAALRVAEAPGVGFRVRTACSPNSRRASRRGRLALNVAELAAVCAWPIGDTTNLPIVRLGSRRLPVPKPVASAGRVVGDSTWPGRARTVALSVGDGLRHMHLLGPTGTGKSTLLLNLALQDIHAGRGLVVVDAKSDLVSDLLARIPKHREHDVVVIGPKAGGADGGDDRVVGINPLSGDGRTPPEVAADQLLEVFHRLYAANWGPRTNDILGAALQTLARVGGMSLPAVPLLLTNPAFRRRIVGQINDPVGLSPFWASFEAWSDAERTTATAPVLNKLRPFLMRSSLRRVVGQTKPAFRFDDIFNSKRIVLVDLAKAQIGSEASALLGALVLSQLWQSILARSASPADSRHPVNVYLDEFQDYLALPLNLEDALTQARGLGVGFTLAHQHLKQLPAGLKSAVMANARSRVCFQLSHEDAAEMARSSSWLGANDFESLETFHAYTQLVANGQVQPWCSIRTRPATRPHRDGTALRTAATRRYGQPAADIDQQLLAMASHGQAAGGEAADDLSPRRRGGTR